MFYLDLLHERNESGKWAVVNLKYRQTEESDTKLFKYEACRLMTSLASLRFNPVFFGAHSVTLQGADAIQSGFDYVVMTSLPDNGNIDVFFLLEKLWKSGIFKTVIMLSGKKKFPLCTICFRLYRLAYVMDKTIITLKIALG